jgi:hypothetical protein
MLKNLVKEFIAFVIARHQVYLRKADARPKPWTKDPILQRYRFCNIYRELDTVTQWIGNEWRTPHATDKDLWFAMAFARLFNSPDTLRAVGYPVPWSLSKMKNALQRVERAGNGVFNGAYIVSTNGVSMPKIQYLCERVLEPLWKHREIIRPRAGDTLAAFATRLQQENGFKGFMAGQVVADLKYANNSPLSNAVDWHTWAVSGPGSRRGLNRVVGRIVDAPWQERQWHTSLLPLQEQLNNGIPPVWGMLHAQDVQNCLCEFDKYMRTKLGEGRPKSTYPGV